MQKRFIGISLIVVLFSFLFISCSKTKDTLAAVTCNPDISFINDVKPVVVASCTASGCHDGVNLAYMGDYLTMRDGAGQIKTAVSKGIMPMNGKLSAADIKTIVCWIENGAKNN
jgi:hypothetical protein